MSLLAKAGKLVRKAGSILASTAQQCRDLCCGTHYCCWNTYYPGDGSTCQESSCPEGLYRSGPYTTAEACEEACAGAPEEYYCCNDGFSRSCVAGPYCYGTIESGPHATIEACNAVCEPLGACCPPAITTPCEEGECYAVNYYWTEPPGGGPCQQVYRDPYEDCFWFTDGCQVYEDPTQCGDYESPVPNCSGTPLGYLTQKLCSNDGQVYPPCINYTTAENCAALGGTFFPNNYCGYIPCPSDCYGSGNHSECGGEPEEPADWCTPGGGIYCSPTVTATITISGIQCLKQLVGGVLQCVPNSQDLADAANDTYILGNGPGTPCMSNVAVPLVIGGLNYLILLSLVPSMPASPPATPGTVCYRVDLAIFCTSVGPCANTGGQFAVSGTYCSVLPVTHTQSCTCTKWYDCSFNASGALNEVFGPCSMPLVDMTNAQFSLTIA